MTFAHTYTTTPSCTVYLLWAVGNFQLKLTNLFWQHGEVQYRKGSIWPLWIFSFLLFLWHGLFKGSSYWVRVEYFLLRDKSLQKEKDEKLTNSWDTRIYYIETNLEIYQYLSLSMKWTQENKNNPDQVSENKKEKLPNYLIVVCIPFSLPEENQRFCSFYFGSIIECWSYFFTDASCSFVLKFWNFTV